MTLSTATPTSAALPPTPLFINRELSWLEFNARVLEEAVDPTNPVLERVKFLAIVSSNQTEWSSTPCPSEGSMFCSTAALGPSRAIRTSPKNCQVREPGPTGRPSGLEAGALVTDMDRGYK